MLIANSDQAKFVDKLTIEKYKTPGLLLMENAGKKVAEVASLYGDNIVILCGKGNNGGDGSVSARHLFTMGKNVTLGLMAKKEDLKGDAKTAFIMAENMGVEVSYGLNDELKEKIKSADLIIDGLLGIGLSSDPRGSIKDAILFLNECNKKIIAIDVPSGVNTDTGFCYNPCIRAFKTVTFGLLKYCHLMYPGKEYCGEVHLFDIGFSKDAVKEANINTYVAEKPGYKNISPYAHKGTLPNILVVAGSKGMTGAGYLSATSALYSGSSIVTWALPDSLSHIAETKTTEVMTLALPSENGILKEESADIILSHIKRYNVLIIGPGLSRNEHIKKLVEKLVLNINIPMIIDADGVFALKDNKEILKNKKCDIIITPHIGEMASFLGCETEDIKNNSVKVAEQTAKEYNITVVLKSAHTIITNGRKTYISSFGNPGMATAGSGDVLSGIIGSFVGKNNNDIIKGAKDGVYFHSYAGNMAKEKRGTCGMTSKDILYEIPNVLKLWENGEL